MCYPWKSEFEGEFKSLLKPKDNSKLRIIIGEKPYKQKLNNIGFKVVSNNSPYNQLGNYVGFFVSDWIKVQDSLEMIFNLLFNGNKNSIRVLSFLRNNNIKADEFADYINKNYSIILTNITNKNKYDNYSNINKFIKSQGKQVCYCLVGKNAQYKFKNVALMNKVEFIHPSGVNLNTQNGVYYSDWYTLKNKQPALINEFIIFN